MTNPMSNNHPIDPVVERDISHWTEWSDVELIEQAACACQRKDLVDDEITRDAIAMNIIAPFRQKLAALQSMPTVTEGMIETGVEYWHEHWGEALLDDFVRDLYLAMSAKPEAQGGAA